MGEAKKRSPGIGRSIGYRCCDALRESIRDSNARRFRYSLKHPTAAFKVSNIVGYVSSICRLLGVTPAVRAALTESAVPALSAMFDAATRHAGPCDASAAPGCFRRLTV